MFQRTKLAICSIALAVGALSPAPATAQTFWQCAPFARMFSGVQLFGAAASWWNQAVGKYSRGDAPKEGAVLVFKAIGSMRSGHVATVSQIVSDRIIKVTHANWSSHGQIEHDVEVVDTSANNDWSRVRVWFRGLHDLGNTSYPVYGFIYGKGAPAQEPDKASAEPVKPVSLNAVEAADHQMKAARAAAPLAALIS